MNDTAIIIVDAQNDFISGSLAVPGADDAVDNIVKLIDNLNHDNFDGKVIMTMDWHIEPGSHWSETPDFKDSWPRHCEASTYGAYIDDRIMSALMRSENLIANRALVTVRKGEYSASYSAFDGKVTEESQLKLHEYLQLHGITTLKVAGLATDYCVFRTVGDAVALGEYEVSMYLDGVAGVSEHSIQSAKRVMSNMGVKFEHIAN